jgi:hypothetical protein
MEGSAVCRTDLPGLKATVKRSANRLMALGLCVLFIAVFLFPAAYILTHANHEHDHRGPGGCCAACVQLAAAADLLKSAFVAMLGAAFVFWGFSAIRSILKPNNFRIGFFTLFSLKVRLNI